MNELILLLSSKYFVKQESVNTLSILSYGKLDNSWATKYNLKIVETHNLTNGSYQYVLELMTDLF